MDIKLMAQQAEGISIAVDLLCLQLGISLSKGEKKIFKHLVLAFPNRYLVWSAERKDYLTSATGYNIKTIHVLITSLRKKGLIKYDFIPENIYKAVTQTEFSIKVELQ